MALLYSPGNPRVGEKVIYEESSENWERAVHCGMHMRCIYQYGDLTCRCVTLHPC